MMLLTREDPNANWWLKSVPEVNTWSDVNILRFLRYYQSHPVLWNVRAPQYKNVCKRRQAYTHIIKLLNLRGVDIDECMKLVEWLKRKYIEEKGVRRSKCEKRPAWFEIIKKIIQRILNPKEEEWNFDCCKQCCTCETPSDSTISSDYQACKDCCADQNLHPPCEYYKASDNDNDDDDEESNRCNFEKIECYTICNDEVQIILLNIGDRNKKYNSDCDCTTDSDANRNSDCDCKTEDDSSKKNSDECICCCKSESLPQVPSSESSCDRSKSSSSKSTNSIPSVSTVAQFCVQPMPTPSESSSDTSSSTSKIVDEKSAGIFMASRRFRGKRISLVDEYKCNDCGDLEIIPPKLHLARCCCASDRYPLQVEL